MDPPSPNWMSSGALKRPAGGASVGSRDLPIPSQRQLKTPKVTYHRVWRHRRQRRDPYTIITSDDEKENEAPTAKTCRNVHQNSMDPKVLSLGLAEDTNSTAASAEVMNSAADPFTTKTRSPKAMSVADNTISDNTIPAAPITAAPTTAAPTTAAPTTGAPTTAAPSTQVADDASTTVFASHTIPRTPPQAPEEESEVEDTITTSPSTQVADDASTTAFGSHTIPTTRPQAHEKEAEDEDESVIVVAPNPTTTTRPRAPKKQKQGQEQKQKQPQKQKQGEKHRQNDKQKRNTASPSSSTWYQIDKILRQKNPSSNTNNAEGEAEAQYLISWSGHQPNSKKTPWPYSWEPESHVTAAALEDWKVEMRKRKSRPGECESGRPLKMGSGKLDVPLIILSRLGSNQRWYAGYGGLQARRGYEATPSTSGRAGGRAGGREAPRSHLLPLFRLAG
ncbi:uncharacterized protein MYCFIDRAFT_84044 [Pseudocercospora fijiensis CIRAD86]|uniref:Chromo domain-containing protein n=1 Tax=Pseudocercospora fijiensis (strain CIRAD86) TaxID=383855 RepID=M3AJ55_PSEFD|nr:uncharacterized protein MYCFIDRAFT_84044 [Pseudocercospora fijiensis CIRAD86]EME77512.1 hypothetical protein MYCFIDRAFT_84044 [Pseudocercospora fijiensis CIRAD86]